MQILQSGRQLTIEDILAEEKKLGCQIPQNYRLFLLKHNGGIPDPADFEVTLKSSRVMRVTLDFFLGIDVEEGITLKYYVDNYKNRIPNDLFPVACDPGGNIICTGVGQGNLGQIFYWDHDEEVEEGKTPDYSNVYKLSDSLEEFLSELK